ncbi:unnamed protein product, partial [Prorocentrum cordatum]
GDQESRRRASDPGLTAAPRRAPRAAPEAAAGSGGGAAARADAEPELPRFGPPEQQPTPARGDGAGGPVASRAPPSFSFGPAASGGPGEDGETGPRGPLARGLPDAAASSIPTTPDFGGWPQQQSGDRPPLQRYKTWPGRTSALEHDRTDSGEPDKEPDEGAAGSLQPAAGSSWSDLRLGGASSVAPRFGLDSPELAEGLEDDSDGSQGPMAQPVWSLGAGGEQRGAGDSPPPDAAVHSPWLHVGPPEPAEDYVRLEAEIESVRHRAVVAALEAEIERLGHSCGELRAELRGRTGLLEGCEQELQTARSELRERRDWQSPQQLWRVVDTREQRAVAAEKEALVLRAELREATLAPRAAAPSAPLSPELQEPACEPPSCEGLPGLEQPGAWWDHCVGLQEEARGELEDIAQHVRDASAELAASRAECADASARHEESAADLHFRLVGSYGRHSDAEAAAQAAQARLEEELVEVREECQAIETALRDELSAAREQRQAVEAALRADLAEASATLRGELLAAREQQLAVEAALRADLAEASGALRGELSAAREQQLAVEVALRSDLAEASEQHRTELGVLREELADASKELRAAEAALPRLLSDASQQRHATEADLQELRLELAVAGEGRQAAEEAQECELAEAHRRHGVAEAVLRGELAEAREQHKQLSTAAAAGRAAAAHQQTELAAARRALTAARSEVEEACQREESVGDLLATLATTRRQLSRARAAEFGAAAESRVGLQEAKGALEAARFGESRLEEDLATALAQRRDALAASESAQRASWGLGRDLAEASEELGRERSALWAARSGLGLSEARLAELEQELGSERVALRDTRADLSRSEAAAAEARTELGRASAALEASRADREECRVLLVAAGEEREEMGRALHATQASLLGSEQISEEMGRSLQVLSEAREELQAAQVRSDDEARGELDHEGAALQVARAELHEAMAQLRNAGNAAVRDVLLAAQQAEEERDVLSTECEEAASRARRAEQQLEETNGRLEQTTLELLAELEAERLASARGAQAALEERAVAAVSAAAAEASAAECARLRAEMASERGRLTEEATTEAEAVQQVERYAGKAMEAASEVCERRVAAAEAAARDAGRRSAAAEAAAAAQRARAAAEMAQLSRRLESELGAYRDEGRAQRHRAEQLQQEARGAAAAELAEACSLGELRASLEQERLEVEQLRREARQAREAEAEAQAQLRRQVGEAREAHQAREARAALEAEAREAHAAEAAGQPRREAREAREARGARDAEAEAVAQLRREAREAREAVAEARLEADRLQREARGQLEARAAREAQHTARARGASEAGEAPEAGAAAREAREAEAEAEGPLGREARATREVGPRDGRGEEGRSDESAGPAGSSPGGLDVDQLSARGKHCDSYGERTCADDEVLDLMGANDIPSEEFGKWTSKGTGTYLEGGMEAGSMLVNQRFCPRTVGGRTWTPFGTGSICTSRGPGDPEFASPPSVVLALGLASEPIRPGFLLASREGSPASAAKGIADGFGCSCAGLPECLPGCCAEGAPSACLADVPTKEDLVGADEHGNLLGIRALKIGGRELYTASRRIELPVRTNQILLQIPAQLRLIHPVVTCLVGGMLSFGAVFTELFFIMSSMWQHQFYSFFGLFALSGCGGLADPAPASAGPCPSSNSSEFQQTAGGERLPINGYAPEVAGFKQFWRMGDQAKVLTCFASLCNGVDVTVAGYLRRLNQERGELFDVFGAMLGMLRAGSPMILCAGVFFEVSLGNQGEIGAGAVSVRVAADQLVDVFIQLAGGFAVFHEQCEVAGGIAEGQWQAEGAGGIAEGLLV